MLRVGEGSSGGGEKKERRERSDDQLRRYASKILEVSMKYGLSQEDEAYLYQMLDMAYGVKFGILATMSCMGQVKMTMRLLGRH